MIKKIFLQIIFPLICIAISIILGVVFGDYIIGTITLASGFLNAYYMAIGKWYNYIFGIIFSVVYAIGCYFNGLFGFVIFTIVVYTPLQIYGLINWIKHKEQSEVKVRSLTIANSLLMTFLMLAGSVGLGFLLSLIPGQNLAFLDSTSQIINLCGVVLGTIRFRESWYIWLANNIIDLVIWIINTINRAPYSEMMLITSIMYLVMNVWGIAKWIMLEKHQKESVKTSNESD